MLKCKKAIEHGYQILKIYELYDFHKEKNCHNYVNTFLKIKQKSSSIPPHCFNNDGAVNKQLLDYEGILLDREKLVKTQVYIQ